MASGTETSRFNPEWMRSLSKPVASGATAMGAIQAEVQSGPMAPPVMAKNRYSREELLALRPPEGTSLDPAIYDRAPSYASEEQLSPICLLPFSEAEERLLALGVNSSKVQSMVNYQEQRTQSGGGVVARGGAQNFPYGPPPMSGPNRGGYSRGGGGGDYYQPQRIRDENYPPGGGGYAPRGRGFTPRGRGGYAMSMDQQQRFGNRSNFYQQSAAPIDVEAPPSLNPRAQALMSDSGGSGGMNARSMMNRQGRGGYHRQHNNSGSWSDRDYNGPAARYRTKSTGQTDMDQDIPEWAQEDYEDDGDATGTFDASGQFKAEKLPPEEPANAQSRLQQRHDSENVSSGKAKSGGGENESNAQTNNNGVGNAAAKPTAAGISGAEFLAKVKAANPPTPDAQANQQQQQTLSAKNTGITGGAKSAEVQQPPPQSQAAASAPLPPMQSQQQQRRSAPQKPQLSQQQPPQQAVPKAATAAAVPPPQNHRNSPDDMFQNIHQHVETLVDSLGAEDTGPRQQQQQRPQKPPPAMVVPPIIQKPAISSAPVTPLQEWAPKSITDIWFYKDPQGVEQGPFETTKMFNWFERGYFTMDLPIRRSIDRDYLTLRHAIEYFCGQVPFVKCQSEQIAKPPSKMQNAGAPTMVPGVPAVVGGAGMLPPQLQPPHLQQSQKSLWDLDPPSPQRPVPVAGQNQGQMADYQQRLKEWETQKRQMEEQQRKLEEQLERDRREKAELEARLKREEDERKRQEVEQQRRLAELAREQERRRQEETERQRREEAERKQLEEERKRAAEATEAARREQERIEQEKLHKEREAATARWAAAQQAERQQAQQPAWQQLLGLHPQPDQPQQQSQQHGQKSPTAVPWLQKEAAAPSLLEIQAEEQRQAAAERKQLEELWAHEKDQQTTATRATAGAQWAQKAATNAAAGGATAWPQSQQQHQQRPAWGGAGIQQPTATREPQQPQGFWDQPKQPPQNPTSGSNSRPSQNRQQQQEQNASPTPRRTSRVQAANVSGDDSAVAAQLPKDPFTRWCFQQVQTFNKDVDPEIFVSFMMSIESHAEVREYVEAYFGQGKPVEIFIKQFLHKREEHRPQPKATAGNDHADFSGGYMSMGNSSSSRQNPPSKKPAAAANQQSTGSGGGAKKQGQGKRVLDSKMLGFTAVGDPNRVNAGEIERPH